MIDLAQASTVTNQSAESTATQGILFFALTFMLLLALPTLIGGIVTWVVGVAGKKERPKRVGKILTFGSLAVLAISVVMSLIVNLVA